MTRPALLFAFCTLLFLTLARPARADDAAAAQELFTEARRLMKIGDYTDACSKLEESQRLDPGMGTLFNLADCNEHLGKTATAWAEFLDVASQAKAAGQAAREKAARARARTLDGKLSRLTILVRGTDAEVTVERDGVPIGRAQWGSAVPVDPGDHLVVARAPGRETWRSVMHVPSDGTTVAVEVPPLDPLPAASAPAPPAPAPPASPSPGALAESAPAASSTAPAEAAGAASSSAPAGEHAHGAITPGRVVALAALALGAAGVGIGTGFGISSKTHHDAADGHCSGGACDALGASERASALHDGDVATVAFAVGAAALVGGGILWFTMTPPAPNRPGAASLGVRGAW